MFKIHKLILSYILRKYVNNDSIVYFIISLFIFILIIDESLIK